MHAGMLSWNHQIKDTLDNCKEVYSICREVASLGGLKCIYVK